MKISLITLKANNSDVLYVLTSCTCFRNYKSFGSTVNETADNDQQYTNLRHTVKYK